MTTLSCAVGDCETFLAGHRRMEACWLCWLAMRPHGWHPGESVKNPRVPTLKTEPIVNSEGDPGLESGPADMPLFTQVHERDAIGKMKERLHAPEEVPEDEVLPGFEDGRLEVLPLLRDPDRGRPATRHPAAPKGGILEGDPGPSAANPRPGKPKITEWDIDWKI